MMTDKPTECSCYVAFDDDYPDTDNAEIVRCDWCKGLEAQLKAANAVCDWAERTVAEHQQGCDCMLCTKIKAWRVTQKGGA